MAEEFKIPENIHPSNERAIAVYVLNRFHNLPMAEIARRLEISASVCGKQRKRGFELATLSKGAPYILELTEDMWRPLYHAGYRRKQDIKKAIENKEIDVYHVSKGGGGTVEGIGRARLYKLKKWLGLPVGESDWAKGVQSSTKKKRIYRRQLLKQDQEKAIAESTSEIEKDNRLRIIAIQHSLTYKHNQSTVLQILNSHKRRTGYNTHEAAIILGISKRNLQANVRAGKLKRNHQNLFTRETLLRWAAENLNGWVILEMIDKGEDLGWTTAHARKGADTWAGLADKHLQADTRVDEQISGDN